MIEFVYNNVKNVSIGHTLFKINYGYHPQVLFKENVKLHLKSCFTNKLAKELKKLIEICCQNIFHAQKLLKKAYNKGVKNSTYALGKKVWLNSKYIKIKWNKKLENKFFESFQVFHIIRK